MEMVTEVAATQDIERKFAKSELIELQATGTPQREAQSCFCPLELRGALDVREFPRLGEITRPSDFEGPESDWMRSSVIAGRSLSTSKCAANARASLDLDSSTE